jgi:hypothetical protein
MLTLVLLLVLVAVCVALADWRWGIAAAILIALVQDPLRKMIPGTPGYLAMASAPVWLAVILSAIFVGQLHSRRYLEHFPRFARWIQVTLIYLALPAALSVTYGANGWMIALLGAFIYGMMYCTLVAGWSYPDLRHGTVRLLGLYAIAAGCALVGGFPDAWGWSERYPAIGTEALGALWVTHRTGEPVFMRAGFFRSPDVMGWHAAMVLMVSALLALRARGVVRGVWGALSVWGAANLWLCGRRKMVSMIPIFLGCYLFLLFRARGARRMLSILGTVLMIAGLMGYVVLTVTSDSSVETFYLTALSEAEVQVQRHGFEAVLETFRQAGFWGYGLGMSQQGIHHIPGEKPLIWQESGTSKLFVEFGVPGALLILGLGFVFLRTAYQVTGLPAREESTHVSAGLFSILAANAAAAVVSAQIFGDVFVAFFLSLLAGLLLAEVRAAPEPEGP